jgi:hypothetical protein
VATGGAVLLSLALDFEIDAGCDEEGEILAMNEFLKWVSSGLTLGAVGAGIAFVVSVFQFLSVRRRESQEREFEKYHALIQRLVAPDEAGVTHLDRQIAVVFELRHFPRYYECTQRILTGLKDTWSAQKSWSRLTDEIDLTLRDIQEKT